MRRWSMARMPPDPSQALHRRLSPVLDHCPFCTLLADRLAPPLAVAFPPDGRAGQADDPDGLVGTFSPPVSNTHAAFARATDSSELLVS